VHAARASCNFRHQPVEDTPLQRKKAVELQRSWGDQPCDHPAFSREYDLGERTGNYCCTRCGASVTFREKAEITAARTRTRGPASRGDPTP
jgi:hypothetical protein